MPIARCFLGWDRPALELAAERVLSPVIESKDWDLQRSLCVFPTARASRQFLTVLVDLADRHGAILAPPVCSTTGRLDTHLLPNVIALASEWESRLAFTSAMRDLDEIDIATIVRRPPARDDWRNWLAIADAVLGLRESLAAHRVFLSQTALEAGPFASEMERRRWLVLGKLEEDYLARLQQIGKVDIFSQREVAFSAGLAGWDGSLFLIATVDLNPAQKELARQAAANGSSVTALVFAPEDLAGGFDEIGVLDVEFWNHRPIALDEEQIHFVNNPIEQARGALAAIVELSNTRRPEEIKIGAPDPAVRSRLEMDAPRLGVSLRSLSGKASCRSAPALFLEALVEYAGRHRSGDFASLVRHPDFGHWLARRRVIRSNDDVKRAFTELDSIRSEHVPAVIDLNCLAGETESTLRRWIESAESLIAQWPAGRADVREWMKAFADGMVELYGDRAFHEGSEDEDYQQSLDAIADAARTLFSVGSSLCVELSVEEAFELLKEQLSSITLASTTSQCVEIVGWLELLLERAPSLLITGMNEGVVPEPVETEMFLTSSLRSALGIAGNAHREARDRYALTSILASHKGVQFFAGRRSSTGDPLLPSRLLLADTAAIRANRLLRFFEKDALRLQLPRVAAPAARLDVPMPEPSEPIDTLRITGFRDYLACPYRFYLRHVRGLVRVDDDVVEFAPTAVGTLAHSVLEMFARSELRDSTDPERIQAFLNEELDRRVKDFCVRPLAAVRIQVELLRPRLERFAEIQANWAAKGWRILTPEVSPATEGEKAPFPVDGIPFYLRGRIDRIDVHRDSGELAILDYKTGDKGDGPHKVHYSKKHGWLDLQLPLYRYLLPSIDLPAGALVNGQLPKLHVGYVLLPKDLSKARFEPAEWTQDELESADEAAREVVRAIRAQRYWPPNPVSVGRWTEYSRICQEEVLGAED